jgi:hypothetical protein
MQPVYDWHPRMENVVYYGMDWLCPGYTKVLSEQLTLHHGNITAENAISDIVAYTQTGNLGNPQPHYVLALPQSYQTLGLKHFRLSTKNVFSETYNSCCHLRLDQ